MATSGQGLIQAFKNAYSGTVKRYRPVVQSTTDSGQKTFTKCSAQTDKVLGILSQDSLSQSKHTDVIISGTAQVRVANGITVTQGDYVGLDSTDFEGVGPLTINFGGSTSVICIGQALETATGTTGDVKVEVRLMLVPVKI